MCKARHLIPSMFIVAVFAVVTTPTSAGLISISSSTIAPSGTGSEILNTGALVSAWSVNAGVGDAVTVNGVDFSVTQPSSVDALFPNSLSNHTLTSNLYTDANLAKLMEDMFRSNTNVLVDMTISDLIVGHTYRAQFLHHHNDGAGLMWVRFGTGASTAERTDNLPAASVGYISTIVFTADSTSQVIRFHTTTSHRATLNAMTLFDLTPPVIPAPAALPAGLMLLGAIAMRRRRS